MERSVGRRRVGRRTCLAAISWTSATRCGAFISATLRRISPTRSISSWAIHVPGLPACLSTSAGKAVDGAELAGRQQVEIEVLLDDRNVDGLQRDGVGPDLGRHVLELDALPPALDVDIAPILDQREVAGV